ncbi:MAG TPA: hypothetical protein VMS00_12435, partial [Acidimicrobiales bacterium]|nr:hypothetical protein [Acidimicrobiales bacterium]
MRTYVCDALSGRHAMVALRWCEDDREEQQEELLGRLTVAGGSPSEREPLPLRFAPREVPYLGGKTGSVVRRRPRTFFWRRVLVVSLIAGLGAMVWLATGRLVSAAGAQAPQSQLCMAGGLPGAGSSAGSCGHAYVARPGDTIWAIAVAYSRGGDPRPLVAN